MVGKKGKEHRRKGVVIVKVSRKKKIKRLKIGSVDFATYSVEKKTQVGEKERRRQPLCCRLFYIVAEKQKYAMGPRHSASEKGGRKGVERKKNGFAKGEDRRSTNPRVPDSFRGVLIRVDAWGPRSFVKGGVGGGKGDVRGRMKRERLIHPTAEAEFTIKIPRVEAEQARGRKKEQACGERKETRRRRHAGSATDNSHEFYAVPQKSKRGRKKAWGEGGPNDPES